MAEERFDLDAGLDGLEGLELVVIPSTPFEGFADDFALAAEALRERARRRREAGRPDEDEELLAHELEVAARLARQREAAAAAGILD